MSNIQLILGTMLTADAIRTRHAYSWVSLRYQHVMEFEYSAPSDLGDAIALLGDPDARVLAGGTDLVVQMRERRREVRHVIDVKRITVLSRLEAEADGSIRIGAALNATVLSRHAAMGAFPAIVQA